VSPKSRSAGLRPAARPTGIAALTIFAEFPCIEGAAGHRPALRIAPVSFGNTPQSPDPIWPVTEYVASQTGLSD